MDAKSLIIRTIFTTAYGAPLDRKWVYIVQAGLHYQKKLKVKKINKVYRITLHTIAIGSFQKEFLATLAQQNGGEYVDLGK